MEKVVKNFLIKNKIKTSSKFLLAVSTGIDSMALLYSFLELKNEYDLDIVVVNINHCKREQSNIEEEYIRQFCQDRNIKCYIKKLEYNQESFNFQSVARKMRYDFFIEIAKKENVDYIVLAHHANDNIETCLMRILRGSSLSGYSGMKEISNYEGYVVLRPFLGIYKDEIEKYQEDKKFLYYQDVTNYEDYYTRNRLRKEVLPILINEEKDLNKKIYEYSNTLYEASKVVNEKRDELIKKIITVKSDITFKCLDFLQISEFMQIEILFELLKEYSLSKMNVLEIIKIIKSGKKNLEVYFLNKFYIIKEYNEMIITKDKEEPLNTNIIIDKVGKYIVNDTIKINVTKKSNIKVTNLQELCYNINKLPIIIRTRRNGDKIKVGDGYQKVKDLLIDKKVGIRKRNNILLATDANGEVLIVFGYKKSSILCSDNCDILIKMEE